VVAHAVPAARLEEAVGAHDVRAHEGLGARDGVVVVGLRREVHDGVVAGDQAVEQPLVADVAHDELDPVSRQPGDVRRGCPA
jgi:hypothetical protein